MSSKRYITQAGYERLAAELDHLWKVERRKVVLEVETAAAHGDRSENAEYQYGKRRLREIDRRVRYLSKLLEQVTVVPPEERDSDQVFFGAWVSVEDEDGEQKTWQLVGRDEYDASAGRISVDSPMGKALLGRKVGDVVTVRRPAGEVELEIIGLRYGSDSKE